MNNNMILGSAFEISLRILVMLDELGDFSLDEESICALDFIAVYASDFNLLDENLHGYGAYRFSEFSARKNLVATAVKELALNGTITFTPDRSGFLYKISSIGRQMCRKLICNYSEEYRIAVRAVLERYNVETSDAMLRDITKHTISSLEEGYDE